MGESRLNMSSCQIFFYWYECLNHFNKDYDLWIESNVTLETED